MSVGDDVHDRFDVSDLSDARTLALTIARHISRAETYRLAEMEADRVQELERAVAACDALQVALDELRGGGE